jgi:hypothetical protein
MSRLLSGADCAGNKREALMVFEGAFHNRTLTRLYTLPSWQNMRQYLGWPYVCTLSVTVIRWMCLDVAAVIFLSFMGRETWEGKPQGSNNSLVSNGCAGYQ